MTKVLFFEGGLSIRFCINVLRDFPDISSFPKILSFKSFGNSWGKSYTKFIILEIKSRFTCGESNLY